MSVEGYTAMNVVLLWSVVRGTKLAYVNDDQPVAPVTDAPVRGEA